MNQTHIRTLDDQELLTRITAQQAGWRDLLSSLLQRHHRTLLSRCYFYLKNQEDAEDAAQETELRVFRAIKNFRGDASFRTWLFAIGHRQCYDIWHKRSRHIIDDHLFALIEIHEENMRRVTKPDEQQIIVNTILTRLPEQERDILVLRFYRDLSLLDISITLGLGLSATKMRLYRALDKFAVSLQRTQCSLSYNTVPVAENN
jgi:RNA polymerase sigma-70 factor (ECF subfamily)